MFCSSRKWIHLFVALHGCLEYIDLELENFLPRWPTYMVGKLVLVTDVAWMVLSTSSISSSLCEPFHMLIVSTSAGGWIQRASILREQEERRANLWSILGNSTTSFSSYSIGWSQQKSLLRFRRKGHNLYHSIKRGSTLTLHKVHRLGHLWQLYSYIM